MSTYQYGILMPHFGSYASKSRLIDGARLIERLGFDSLWVRDHVVFQPHPFEDQNLTHVDPFVALGSIAAVTERVTLGTGSLIPHRHPIHTALSIGSLDFMAGPGRLIVGFGLGSFPHEFEAVGMGELDRKELLQEQIEVMRKLWTGAPVTHDGAFYHFKDVQIQPIPERSVPVWYCGASLAAVRRAVEYCDGWIPGRMPLPDFRKRVQRMTRLAEEAGKPVPDAGSIPYVVLGKTPEEALRHVNLPPLFAQSDKRYIPPNDKARFETADDLDGALIYGPSDRIVDGLRRLQGAGASHLVFDLRLQFDTFEEVVQQIAEEILPELRRGDRAPAPVSVP